MGGENMIRKIAPIFITALTLQGCATLQGSPTPVLLMDDLVQTARLYPPDLAIQQYNQRRDPLGKDFSEQRAYRDQVLFTYLAAIDARYRNFEQGLTSQNKFGNSLASVLSLYTSALASVASGDLATGFATSSTFLQGAQGSLNKELFFEQTLPALISVMEAERSRIRAEILRSLARDTKSDRIVYGMAEALNDISRYQDAASVETAVAKLIQDAAEDRAEQQENLSNAQEAREKAGGKSNAQDGVEAPAPDIAEKPEEENQEDNARKAADKQQ